MTETFRNKHFPLGFHIGRSFWRQLDLTAQFRKEPPPGRTYLRQLIADQLRHQADSNLTAAELELLTIINRILVTVGRQFLQSRNCRVYRNRLTIAGKTTKLPDLESLLQHFLQLFPALPIELTTTASARLLESLEQTDQLNELLLEIFLLRVQSRNPALQSARELFLSEEQQLQQRCRYQQQLSWIDRTLPDLDDGSGQRSDSLLARLLEPLQQADTLHSQLRLLQQTWASLLPDELQTAIAGAFAIYDREGFQPGFPGEPETVTLDPAIFSDQEYANFTVDLDWMPRTVLLAKATYVWLRQLSVKYRRQIERLDQIPDEELAELAEHGFTSLWLIGIWQRSKASLKIKNLCGQLQVTASAYAIDDYRIADDLGGDPALENLRQRCREKGIDLACDVVTNHTGIESAWLHEHPNWFIQTTQPPYPGYRFAGPDLSENPEYSIQIEDGYYDHSEAAVVCRYQHRRTGEVRYLYHGNDGTHLPWNDTAQLNFLLPEVREAMIQLVIRAAKRFRVIRFDAAMTLAKRHFQRLWYPLPGGGAGVPSRADHAMPQEEFQKLFPVEFWRELVDRIRDEAPDTLLVAEAFWLMEGYFVRTLGMHRVYNSAFMNMLKREENEKYRQTLKNILAFDPAILQRFVNFMSNPDEKPAVEQFGKEDKYFCIATMLVTMPGLPMFGHGQIEGYSEKYGMEYLAPRRHEEVDQQLVERHRREIFPLLRRRALFSDAEEFQLYDFVSDYGVEQNVFVYSNRLAEKRVLILCNNSAQQISGRIGPAQKRATEKTVDFIQACNFEMNGDFLLMTDLSHRVQHLQPISQLLNGGRLILQPYSYRVLSDFHTVTDAAGHWQQLWERYGDSGRPDLQLDYLGLLLEPARKLSQQLREITRPARAREQVAKLLEQLCEEFSSAAISQYSAASYLQLQLNSHAAEKTVLPGALIEELDELLIHTLPLNQAQMYQLFDRLFSRREWRYLLKCNYYNEQDWFNKEAFARLLTTFLQYIIFSLNKDKSYNIDQLLITTCHTLNAFFKAERLAEKFSFQVDNFLCSLDTAAEPDPVLPPATGGDYAMKILFVTSEATPFAKTGGLADVTGSLPRALRQLGHDVRVILPCHRTAERSGIKLKKGRKSIEINLSGKNYRGSLKQTSYDGVPFWFIDCPEFFDRDPLYGTAEGNYPDNSLRFGFFCRAVLEMTRRLDFRPDVIHVHDWQTSLVPVLLRTEFRHNPFYGNIATLLTIHNLGYQGIFPLDMLPQLNLPESLGTSRGMEYFGDVSTLKGGINYADVINTVSPTYCREIQTPEQGHGFDGMLRERVEDLHGIINGLDRRCWDPAFDTALPTPFNVDNLNGKRACKRLLQKELGLEARHDIPIISVISRLDRQKGIDLIKQIWPQLLERDIQFILLGSGDHEAMAFWREQQKQRPQQVSINLTFDEGLSRRIFAASDILLIPSLYEPCGLTQMIALQYGALPVVRKTGGLVDTVIDVDKDPRQGYGFVFDDFSADQLLSSIDRALTIYPERSRWLTLVKRGMSQDFSWGNSALQYHELYLKARDYRQMPAV